MSSDDALQQAIASGYKAIYPVEHDLIKLVGEDATQDIKIYIGSLRLGKERGIITNSIMTASIMGDIEYINEIANLGEQTRLQLQRMDVQYNQSDKIALSLTRLYKIH